MSTQEEKTLTHSNVEEALQKADIQALTILESITDGFVILDKEWRFLYINPQGERLVRCKSQDKLLGRSIWEVYPEVAGSIFDQKYREARAQQVKVRFEVFCPLHDTWYEFHAYPLKEGLSIYFTDVTERKRAEEARQLGEVKFKRLFEAGIVGMIVVDATGKIHEANDVFLRMTGYQKDELLSGQVCWHDLTPPEYLEAEAKMAQKMIETGEVIPWEKEYIRKDGSRFPALVGGALIDTEKILAVALILDISVQKELEQRKDDFISIASHELKTPITTIQVLAQYVKKRLEKQGTDELVTYLSKMEMQIKNLTRLINELLDVSKIQAGKLDYANEVVDIDALVHDITETLQQISKTHTITVHGSVNKHIKGDRERLGQVFTNLINNAMKYSPKADTVDIHLAASQDAVIVRIQDYGVGIPKEHQNKIFDRFYRVSDGKDTPFAGLGMGLYISSEIVKRHGGEMRVESEAGKGSTFTVCLPYL